MVAAPRLRCDSCGADVVRFDEEGRGRCWVCWWDAVLAGWAARCSDVWYGRQVLETLLRQARPVGAARIVALVSWHPLRRYEQAERDLRLPAFAASVQVALDELVALGVAARVEGGYVWSEMARRQIHGDA